MAYRGISHRGVKVSRATGPAAAATTPGPVWKTRMAVNLSRTPSGASGASGTDIGSAVAVTG